MTVRNQHWYNRNETRKYPLTDAATGVTDDGLLLPSDIIADLMFRYPADLYGTSVFLGAVSVSPSIVSVIILSTYPGAELVRQSECSGPAVSASGSASASVGTIPDPIPLAAVTVQKPVNRFRHVALQPLVPGVGGWIVFGAGANNRDGFIGRFSTAQQSELNLNSGQPTQPVNRPPSGYEVSSFGKFGSSLGLTGVVLLRAGTGIEIVAGTNEIASLKPPPFGTDPVLPVIRIRLKDQEDLDVFQEFAGPCQGRPESRTCEGLQPIEFINNVPPDCDGNITIEFEGCAEATEFTGEPSGAILNCDIGLSDACNPEERLPDDQGNLPSEGDDDCEA